MRRVILFLSCTALALAQDRQSDPVGSALQAYHHAREQGNFAEAAARREEARTLLAQTPVDSPAFGDRVFAVQQIYQNSGRRAQARALLTDALDRVKSPGEPHRVRICLLSWLADSWLADGNLLKALSYREQTVAAIEAAPLDVFRPASSPFGQARFVRITGGFRTGMALQPWDGVNKPAQYRQLAELYRQLGRPDAAAKALAKERALVQDDPKALAAFYESHGNLDEAAAIYKKQAEQAAINPKAQTWEVVNPLQSVASLYQRQERWDEAAAALEQAASSIEASGATQAGNQAVNIRINMANLLQRAGRTPDADRVYQALFSETSRETQTQVIQAYAYHLSTTNRAGQGEDLLRTYLSDHSDLPPWQETNILSALASTAAAAGHNKLADEYRRAVKEKQLAIQPSQRSERPVIGPDLAKAGEAVNAGHIDEGVSLASQAIASAPGAQDGDQIGWHVPSIASMLSSKKAADQGDRLYQELFAQLQTTSVDGILPLLQALQQYGHFLIGRKDRWAEVPGVIERYREAVVAAYGTDTSEFNQTILLQSEFARASGAPVEAERAAEQLLTHEASLSGVTSEPYMNAAQTAAGIYESTRQPEHALELRLQVVAIADQVLLSNDAGRAFARMNAANALIGVRKLDEAERLASEAVSITEHARGCTVEGFMRQLEQIRRMKATTNQR